MQKVFLGISHGIPANMACLTYVLTEYCTIFQTRNWLSILLHATHGKQHKFQGFHFMYQNFVSKVLTWSN